MAARTLRIGMTGPDVADLQRAIGVHADGDFGPKTESALVDWQEAHGLYGDGVCGPLTHAALAHATATLEDAPTRPGEGSYAWARADADKYGDGYDRFTLRSDVAARYQQVYDIVREAGGIITSAGGRRNLTASVGANRSALSLHYLGRALDLALYSGMVNPNEDPFIVTLDDRDKRLWRVWARAKKGTKRTLQAWTYTKKSIWVEATVIDFTALMQQHGFERIPARASFFGSKRNDGAAEWWHFSYVEGLVKGVTTFGEELEKVWTPAQLKGTGPWARRDSAWTGTSFS
jgi:peptidoglycan hydrolase-like protein with peptidoglycan-binding domain